MANGSGLTHFHQLIYKSKINGFGPINNFIISLNINLYFFMASSCIETRRKGDASGYLFYWFWNFNLSLGRVIFYNILSFITHIMCYIILHLDHRIRHIKIITGPTHNQNSRNTLNFIQFPNSIDKWCNWLLIFLN